jgi:hypothetical protein
MATDFCCLIGAGEIFVRKRGVANEAWRTLGNVTALSLGHEEDEKTVRNGITGSGNACSVRLISQVTVNITLNCFKAENWELATFGQAKRIAGSTPITDEPHAFAADVIYLNAFPKASPAIAVKVGTDAATATAAVLDTDYTLSDGGRGIVPKAGSVVMVAGTGNKVFVTYTPEEQISLQGLVNSGYNLELLWKGVNKGDNDLPVWLHMYNVRFGAAGDLQLLSDDFVAMELEGEMTADTAIVNPGGANALSQYYNLQYKVPAA